MRHQRSTNGQQKKVALFFQECPNIESGFRNSLTREDAIARIDSQMSQEERIEHSHVVVVNDGTTGDLADNAKKIWNTRVVNK